MAMNAKVYLVLARFNYDHPQYTSTSVAAQDKVKMMNGQNSTWYCGAWLGYGFHEDGCKSGLEAAVAISGNPVPWATEVKHNEAVKFAPKPKGSWLGSLFAPLTRPLIWALESLCRSQILAFMSKAVKRGRLTFITPEGKRYSFGQVMNAEDEDVTVLVYKSWFWVRVALEADLGLARSYIAGEWAVQHCGPRFDGLTSMLSVLLANMPTGKTHVSGGLDASRLVSAWVGSALNWLWFRLTMDNSISNSRSNIHAVSDSHGPPLALSSTYQSYCSITICPMTCSRLFLIRTL
jgi:cyclopropane-fatty-acyl-phospholipid synthase